MSSIPFPHLNESTDPAAANQALCADLSLLFTLLITGLIGTISRTGGKPLADQYKQQLNRYAEQHGWSVLTGLAELTELRHSVPDVDAKTLLSVYRSYAQQAQMLAEQILGEQLLKSTVAAVWNRLPPQMVEVNARYRIISL